MNRLPRRESPDQVCPFPLFNFSCSVLIIIFSDEIPSDTQVLPQWASQDAGFGQAEIGASFFLRSLVQAVKICLPSDEYGSEYYNYAGGDFEEVAPYEEGDGVYEEYDDVDGFWEEEFDEPAVALEPHPDHAALLSASPSKRSFQESEEESPSEHISDSSLQGSFFFFFSNHILSWFTS